MVLCPRSGATLAQAGRHVLIDLFGATHLADCSYIQHACEDAARATGATILGVNFHHFGDSLGVSGVVLLAESHLSVHTWPEFGLGVFDIFVCGECDPHAAVVVLKDRFNPTDLKVESFERGQLAD